MYQQSACRREGRSYVVACLLLLVTTPAVFGQVGLCQLKGVSPRGIYDRPVTITLADPVNQAGASIVVDGKPYVPGRKISEDGHYVAEVRAVGPVLASELCEPVSFTIDTTPPVIQVVRPEWLPEGAMPRIEVIDDNLGQDGVRVILDGEPYDPSLALEPGEHVVEVEAKDAAGNVATATEVFVQAALACAPDSWVEYSLPTTKLSAAFYFIWYTQSANCPANTLWCNCVSTPKPQNPRPALGFYGSNVQSVVDAQLDQMIANGIDVVAVEWTGLPPTNANFLNPFLPSIASRNLKFVLLYDTFVRLGNGNTPVNFDDNQIRNTFINDFQNFASSSSFFKHSKYLKFGNEPVIYVFTTRAIIGSEANIRSAFDAAHAAAVNNGFSGLYLVADHVFWGTIDWTPLEWMQPSAITSFAPVNPDQGVPQDASTRPIRQWADKMATLYTGARNAQTPQMPLVDLTPGIFVQWNNIGLNTQACFPNVTQIMQFNLLDGSDWSYMIQKAGLDQARLAEVHLLKRNCGEIVLKTPANGTSIVWTYSYNEWYEGAGMERLDLRSPAYPYGFGLQPLQLLKQKLP